MILSGWDQPAYLQMLILAKIQRVPTITFYESTLESRGSAAGLVAAYRSIFLRSCERVIVPSRNSRMAVLACGVKEERVSQISNSFNTRMFNRLASEFENRSRSSFIYVGQLIVRKNVEALVEALASLPGTSLEVVGGGVEEDRLKVLCADLGIEERVTFHGHVRPEEVPVKLDLAHCLVLPSIEEVYGFTAVEAAVAGMHVVVSTAAGVADVLAPEAGVYLAEPTVDGIRAAMMRSKEEWSGLVARDVAQLGGTESMVRAIGGVLGDADE